ncbi:MAG: hypothetical protein ACYS47_10945 [Planctomycetota bacterium]|jgi:tetratricopeptide (TPR) repeat protein
MRIMPFIAVLLVISFSVFLVTPSFAGEKPSDPGDEPAQSPEARRRIPEDQEFEESEPMYYSYGMDIPWIHSLGRAAPPTDEPSPETEKDKLGNLEEVFEVRTLAETLQPMLIYFFRGEDSGAGETRSHKKAVVACDKLEEEVFLHPATVDAALDYVCIRIDVGKAPKALIAKNGITRVPTILLLDIHRKKVGTFAKKSISKAQAIKELRKARKKAHDQVKALASIPPEDPRTESVKARLLVIEQVKLFEKGWLFLNAKKWAQAASLFKKAIGLSGDEKWQDRSSEALAEVEAGRMYENAEYLCKKRKYGEAKRLLEELLVMCDEAVYYPYLAREKLAWIEDKLKKK